MLRRMDSARMLDNAFFYLRSPRIDFMYDRAFLEPGGALFHHYQRVNFNILPLAPSFTATPRNHKNNLQSCRSFNSSADYAKLGLPPTASRAEIKSAYFSLVKKLHPDSGGDAKQFNEVTEAYKRLMHDLQYVDQARSGHSAQHQDPQWQQEMERKERARMWQRMMMEEERRRRRQRTEFNHGFDFSQTHKNNPEREAAMNEFFRSLFLRMLGAFIVLELFFAAITPSGCPLYAQGCGCPQCMSRENYMKRLNGTLGHPRGCECKLCTRGYRKS